MRAASIALALGVFTSGLFSGLLAAVLFLLPSPLFSWEFAVPLALSGRGLR